MVDYVKLAELEVGWWKAHHKKKYNGEGGVIDLMTQEYMLLYGMEEEIAKNCVMHRILAAKEHDLAERENTREIEANQHWQNALEHMKEHFRLLEDFLN